MSFAFNIRNAKPILPWWFPQALAQRTNNPLPISIPYPSTSTAISIWISAAADHHWHWILAWCVVFRQPLENWNCLHLNAIVKESVPLPPALERSYPWLSSRNPHSIPQYRRDRRTVNRWLDFRTMGNGSGPSRANAVPQHSLEPDRSLIFRTDAKHIQRNRKWWCSSHIRMCRHRSSSWFHLVNFSNTREQCFDRCERISDNPVWSVAWQLVECWEKHCSIRLLNFAESDYWIWNSFSGDEHWPNRCLRIRLAHLWMIWKVHAQSEYWLYWLRETNELYSRCKVSIGRNGNIVFVNPLCGNAGFATQIVGGYVLKH